MAWRIIQRMVTRSVRGCRRIVLFRMRPAYSFILHERKQQSPGISSALKNDDAGLENIAGICSSAGSGYVRRCAGTGAQLVAWNNRAVLRGWWRGSIESGSSQHHQCWQQLSG
jgi:hypothetical protein